MNTQLQTFQFHTHQLNVIVDDSGEPWFIAKQVAEILEYSDAEAMTRKLDNDEKSNRQIVGLKSGEAYGPNSGGRGITCISESGLYSALLTSKKPAAKAFKRWVTHEVLPSIRKTGGYQADSLLATEVYKLQSELLQLYRENTRLLQAPVTLPPKRKAWTTEEDNVVHARRAEGLGAGRISKILGRTYDSTRHRIRRLEGMA